MRSVVNAHLPILSPDAGTESNRRDNYISESDLDDLDMHGVRFKPTGLDALCKNTKFTRKELQIMYRGFKQVRCSVPCKNSDG